MKTYKYAGFVLLLNCAAFSNDCSVVFGRNDEVVGVKAKNISMREEEIVITLRKDYYEVDVTFDFFNSGAAENIQLGFPVEGHGALFKNFNDTGVYDFKSYINGKILPHTLKKDTTARLSDLHGGEGTMWFIRKVTFPANARTVSRVTYKAKYNSSNCFKDAGYIYGTGRYWKGGIEKMAVVINHGDDVLIGYVRFTGNDGGGRYQGAFFGGISAKSSKFIWEADGKYRYVFENVMPDDDDDQIIINVGSFGHGLYGEYSGHFGVHPEERWTNYLDLKTCCDWPWSDNLLYKNPADVRHFTKNQIRLFINFFFAKHGYDFKKPLYREYFRKMKQFGYYTGNGPYYYDFQPESPDNKETKYEVNPGFKESGFNEYERKNIDYLLKLEKMIPQ